MPLPPYSRIEQETTITFNAAENTAIVTSFHPSSIAKLIKLGHTVDRNIGRGRVFIIPKRCVSFRKPQKRLVQPNSGRFKPASAPLPQKDARHQETWLVSRTGAQEMPS